MRMALSGLSRALPSPQKKRIIERTRKRENRGRTYLIAAVLIILAVGVGYYVYASATAGKPDFMIAAPIGVTIHAAGTPTISTINVTTVNQFSGTIHLTATGSTGLTATISPSSLTGSGTATLTTSSQKNGSYTVTINATSGGLIHTVTPKVATPVFATLVTSAGTIVVELYQVQAPKTVTNFVNLAGLGFYNNLTWHRIVRGFVIQTGDPNTKNGGGDRSSWGNGGSSQTVPLEIVGDLRNKAGYLGMARSSDPNSGSSQFYINLADNPNLDGGYTVFGKVISGMDVALTLGNTPVSSQYQPNEPINPVFLTSVTITSSP
jgi:cyclophilin family peptidyl-prolyl cis-trans isomerase